MTKQTSSTSLIRDLKRKTRKHYSSEEKIRIVLEGMRGEVSVSELWRLRSCSKSNILLRNLLNSTLSNLL